MSNGNRANVANRQNPNQNNYNQNKNNNRNYNNQNQNNNSNQNQEQSSNQLQLSVASRRALDVLKKARAKKSTFMVIEPNQTLKLQFNPTKSHVEEKIFNGQKTERVAHSVVNIDDRGLEKKHLA